MTLVARLILFVVLAPIVYLIIALVLTLFPPAVRDDQSLNFDRLKDRAEDGAGSAPLVEFKARDGETLSYRHITAEATTSVIILHGSGYNGAYLEPMARYLADTYGVDVFLPNVRGHFGSGARRGDIDTVGQLEDDIADLINLVRSKNPQGKILIGGHSSGGAMAIRFAASDYSEMAEGYFMLAPVLGHRAPTHRKDSGGWAHISLPRIIGLSMLGNVGIHWFDGLETIRFNMPEDVRDGTETLAYSWRLMTNFNLHPDYEADIRSLPDASLTLVGRNDEAMHSDKFNPLFNKLEKYIEVMNDHDHFSLIQSRTVFDRIGEWITDQQTVKSQ